MTDESREVRCAFITSGFSIVDCRFQRVDTESGDSYSVTCADSCELPSRFDCPVKAQVLDADGIVLDESDFPSAAEFLLTLDESEM